jgi:hypothetical protein
LLLLHCLIILLFWLWRWLILDLWIAYVLINPKATPTYDPIGDGLNYKHDGIAARLGERCSPDKVHGHNVLGHDRCG